MVSGVSSICQMVLAGTFAEKYFYYFYISLGVVRSLS